MRRNFYKELYLLEDLHWWHKAKRHNAHNLLKLYLPKSKVKILDIGCGTGKNIEELSILGEIWGIDISKDAVNYCKKRGLKNIVLGPAEATNFRAKSFDIVTLFDVLEHTDDEKTLKEISRILKPGGLLIITVPAFQQLWSQWDVVLHHHRRYTKASLQKILAKYSFTPLNNSYMFSFLFLPTLFVRKIKSRFFKNNYPSDFKLNAPIINTMFYTISRFESPIIPFGIIPFGTSIICIAQKNEK